MTWKWPRTACALALLPALMACDTGQEHDQERTDGPDMATRSAPAPLMPNDHSGVTGTVLADRDGGDIMITLSLEGLEPAVTYLASVHADRCAVDGPVRVPLGRVTGEGDGTASASLRAGPEEMPEDFPWSVQIQTDAGVTVACADVVAL
jgi:hypothetical protein